MVSSFSNPEPDPVLGTPVIIEPEPSQPTQRFVPGRVGAALITGGALWIGPFIANNLVLLPARLQEIAPDEKVGLVALLAVVGSLVALCGNILFGALSDLTRSRFGRRTPWMILGSVGAAASLLALSASPTPVAIVITWCFFQLFLNAIAAPLLAMLADRVPQVRRGTFSALYGIGVLVGATGLQITASGFVTAPAAGMVITAVLVLFAGPVAALLAGEASSKDLPRAAFSARMVLSNFAFPRRGARDFYLALSGKLLFILGLYAVLGYQLFILTDYIGLSLTEAGALTATLGLISLATSLVCGIVAGPLSDKLGRRKVLVIGSAALVALSMLAPFLAPTALGMMIFGLVSGIGNGIFNSVDQALNIEVLPSPATAAKDLGILNMANTGGQILGPAVTSVVLTASGSYGVVFVVAAVIVLIGAALIAPIRAVR